MLERQSTPSLACHPNRRGALRGATLTALAAIATWTAGCTSSSSGDAVGDSVAQSEIVTRRLAPRVDSIPVEPMVTTSTNAGDPLLVGFSVENAADFDVASFHWEFGDGESVAAEAPSHRYAEGGTYHPVLSYSSAEGEAREQRWSVLLNNPPSVAINDAGVLEDTDGMGVWLEASVSDPDGFIPNAKLLWNFGDGDRGRGDRVTHVFENEGLYQVTVTVTDKDGAMATDRIEVDVARRQLAPPPAEEPIEEIASDPVSVTENPPRPGDADEVVGSPPTDGESADDGVDGDGEVVTAGESPTIEENLPVEPVPDVSPDPVQDPIVADEEPAAPVGDELPEVIGDDLFGGDAPVVGLDFDLEPSWIDGTLLAHATDPSAVYSGAGSLAIHAGSGPLPEAALAALDELLAPFEQASELHASWFARTSDAVTLSTDDGRAAASALLDVADSPLTDAELDLLSNVASLLEENPGVELPIEASTWYCFEVSATRVVVDGADFVELTASVRGNPVLAGTVPAASPSLALRVAVAWMLQNNVSDESGATTWIDALRLGPAAFGGCNG